MGGGRALPHSRRRPEPLGGLPSLRLLVCGSASRAGVYGRGSPHGRPDTTDRTGGTARPIRPTDASDLRPLRRSTRRFSREVEDAPLRTRLAGGPAMGEGRAGQQRPAGLSSGRSGCDASSGSERAAATSPSSRRAGRIRQFRPGPVFARTGGTDPRGRASGLRYLHESGRRTRIGDGSSGNCPFHPHRFRSSAGSPFWNTRWRGAESCDRIMPDGGGPSSPRRRARCPRLRTTAGLSFRARAGTARPYPLRSR